MHISFAETLFPSRMEKEEKGMGSGNIDKRATRETRVPRRIQQIDMFQYRKKEQQKPKTPVADYGRYSHRAHTISVRICVSHFIIAKMKPAA